MKVNLGMNLGFHRVTKIHIKPHFRKTGGGWLDIRLYDDEGEYIEMTAWAPNSAKELPVLEVHGASQIVDHMESVEDEDA